MLLNLQHPQPHQTPKNLPGHEAGSSSTVAPQTETVQHDTIMTEATQENVVTEQTELITPEFVAQVQIEDELKKKEEIQRKAKEETDRLLRGLDQDEEHFDTDNLLNTPPHSSSQNPPIPSGSPSKDPSPPPSEPEHKSSSSSSSHHSPPPAKKTRKDKSNKKKKGGKAALTASKRIKKALDLARKKKKETQQPTGDLHDQVQLLSQQVKTLTSQVKDLQDANELVNKVLHADMDGMIKEYTTEYLNDNLAAIAEPAVSTLMEPIRSKLNTRIKHNIERMLESTPFYLRTNRDPPPPEDLST
ncbi:hypothetical protein CTI12_AA577420 [Artemisia annua]|uniref:Uncharacterized protein n=1 Tax=Artemisia annua TaxID=35608 RepID=A0A2U1KQK7_ARTAN|nr:hypothetical protein CTI12_AA577420 [Artemisia annua]